MNEKNRKRTILLTWCLHVKISTYVISYGIVDTNKVTTHALLLCTFEIMIMWWNSQGFAWLQEIIINCQFNSLYLAWFY